jgi:hypothetical protein
MRLGAGVGVGENAMTSTDDLRVHARMFETVIIATMSRMIVCFFTSEIIATKASPQITQITQIEQEREAN